MLYFLHANSVVSVKLFSGKLFNTSFSMYHKKSMKIIKAVRSEKGTSIGISIEFKYGFWI